MKGHLIKSLLLWPCLMKKCNCDVLKPKRCCEIFKSRWRGLGGKAFMTFRTAHWIDGATENGKLREIFRNRKTWLGKSFDSCFDSFIARRERENVSKFLKLYSFSTKSTIFYDVLHHKTKFYLKRLFSVWRIKIAYASLWWIKTRFNEMNAFFIRFKMMKFFY